MAVGVPKTNCEWARGRGAVRISVQLHLPPLGEEPKAFGRGVSYGTARLVIWPWKGSSTLHRPDSLSAKQNEKQ